MHIFLKNISHKNEQYCVVVNTSKFVYLNCEPRRLINAHHWEMFYVGINLVCTNTQETKTLQDKKCTCELMKSKQHTYKKKNTRIFFSFTYFISDEKTRHVKFVNLYYTLSYHYEKSIHTQPITKQIGQTP